MWAASAKSAAWAAAEIVRSDAMATIALVNLRQSMYLLNGSPSCSLNKWAKRLGDRKAMPAASSKEILRSSRSAILDRTA